MRNTTSGNGYMDALGHIYTAMTDLAAWFRRLTPGQREDIARLMADWAAPSRRAEPADQNSHGCIPKIKDVERDLIHQAIQACHGDISQAARALGVGKTTIYRKLREWGENPKLLSQAAALAQYASGSEQRAVRQ
jgi:DNA-binding NtrC family response regulator